MIGLFVKLGIDKESKQRYNILVSEIFGCIAQLARACGSYPQCHWFESNYSHHRPGGQEA